MVDIFNELIPANELTDIARLMVADEDYPQNQFLLNRWFPAISVDEISFKWKLGTTRTYTAAAPFRNFDVPAHIGTRPGRASRSGEMPPISMEYPLTELDALKLRDLRRTAGGREVVEGDVFNDILKGINAIRARFELVMSDSLVTGVATLTEKGISLSADWKRAAGRASTVAIAWAANPATAVPMTNEEAILTTLQDEENLAPGDLYAVMNRTTWRAYKNTTQVKSAFPSFRVLDTLSVAAANRVRQDNDFPEVIVYHAKVTDYSGSNRLVIPDGKVLYLPKGPVGQTQYGIPVAAMDPRIELTENNMPGPVAYQTLAVNPYQLSTVVDALGFPVFTDPNATYCLTV
jgi:hypothetical protein